jgi:hypothetical protein
MSGQMFEHQFTKSGVYNYFCQAHPWMVGTIIVKEGPDWTPPSSSPPSSSTSKIPTILKLDVIDNTFKLQGPDSKADVIITGQLFRDGTVGSTFGAKIKLVTDGFTLSEPTLTTIANGKFTTKISFSKEFVGKQMSVQVVFDGDKKLKYSKSQTEYFTILSKSDTSTPGIGGPTFLKLEIETDKRVVTVSGKLTDPTGKFTVRNVEIILIPSGFAFNENAVAGKYGTSSCKVSGFPNCELTTDNFGDFYVKFGLGPSSISKKYSIQAVFDGNNQWDPSKSLRQSFITGTTVNTSPSQPPTQSSESFDPTSFIGFMVVLAVIMVGIIAVVKRRKKTPIPPIPASGGGKRRKSKPGASSKVGGATAHRTFECPVCKRGNIEQNTNGSEFCRDCGWKN